MRPSTPFPISPLSSPLLPLAARIDRRRRAAATLRTKSVVPSRPCPASRCGEHRLLPRFLSVLLPCRFVVPRAPTACFGGPSMAPPRTVVRKPFPGRAKDGNEFPSSSSLPWCSRSGNLSTVALGRSTPASFGRPDMELRRAPPQLRRPRPSVSLSLSSCDPGR